MIAPADRDADEGNVALDCDRGDGAERAVAARDADRALWSLGGRVARVLAEVENASFDAPFPGFTEQRARVRLVVAGARIDDEESAHCLVSL